MWRECNNLQETEKFTNQETYWAFFKIMAALIVTRIARSKLRLYNQFSELFNVDIFIHIQTLWLCIPFFHHLPLPSQLITHHKSFNLFNPSSTKPYPTFTRAKIMLLISQLTPKINSFLQLHPLEKQRSLISNLKVHALN